MRTYSRRTRVAAPIDDVWDFHTRIEGLEALTPDFLHLEVEEVRDPGTGPNPEELTTGCWVRMSIRPFGVGPRQRWVSRITERVEEDGTRWFRDVMEGGPFRTWEHTHVFFRDSEGQSPSGHRTQSGDEEETVVQDRVRFELPFWPVGPALEPLSAVGFEPMFRYRHRKTKEILED